MIHITREKRPDRVKTVTWNDYDIEINKKEITIFDNKYMESISFPLSEIPNLIKALTEVSKGCQMKAPKFVEAQVYQPYGIVCRTNGGDIWLWQPETDEFRKLDKASKQKCMVIKNDLQFNQQQ